MDTRNRTAGLKRLWWFITLYVASAGAFAAVTYGFRALIPP
jgi:hypothetical protein